MLAFAMTTHLLSARRAIDITGQKFGRLLVIKPMFSRPNTGIHWMCLCDCGTETTVRAARLRNGSTVSCGCAKKSHGHSGDGKDIKPSPTYLSWRNMICRCTTPSASAYNHYKNRGITVCERWRSFENFLADMGERPGGKREYSIERIDNDRGYEPDNCIWATWKVQASNRTSNAGEKNPAAKLTDAQVMAIRADNRPQRAIADEYGVCQTQISRIKRRVQRA